MKKLSKIKKIILFFNIKILITFILTFLLLLITYFYYFKYEDFILEKLKLNNYTFLFGFEKNTKPNLIILGDNYIEFCELDISEEEKSGSEEKYREIFHGLFLIADYKNIQFKTVLQSEFLGSLISEFDMSILNFREEIKLKKIKVQNFKFNKHFSVYGEDDIEARKILSPVILENLGNFAEENNMTIKLSFINNQVFIALGIGQIFEPDLKDVLPLKKINLDLIEKDAERIYNEMSLVSDIIKDLRLNSHIQSK